MGSTTTNNMKEIRKHLSQQKEKSVFSTASLLLSDYIESERNSYLNWLQSTKEAKMLGKLENYSLTFAKINSSEEKNNVAIISSPNS